MAFAALLVYKNFHVLHNTDCQWGCGGLSNTLLGSKETNNPLSWLELPSAWAVLGLVCPRLGLPLARAALSLGCTMFGPALGFGSPRLWQPSASSVLSICSSHSAITFCTFSLENLGQLKETIIVFAKFFALQNLCKAGALEWYASKRSKKVMLMQK